MDAKQQLYAAGGFHAAEGAETSEAVVLGFSDFPPFLKAVAAPLPSAAGGFHAAEGAEASEAAVLGFSDSSRLFKGGRRAFAFCGGGISCGGRR